MSKKVNLKMFDGLVNLFSGLGTAGRDRAKQASFQLEMSRNWQEWEAMYAEEGIARKVIEIIPGDMLREWRKFEDNSQDQDQQKKIRETEQRFKYRDTCAQALTWARLYGGASIIPVLEGDPDYSKPFNPAMIRKNGLKRFAVVDARNLPANTSGTIDPLDDNFLEPEFYTTSGGRAKKIHKSWLFRANGIRLPQNLLTQNGYYHLSVLENIKREIKNAITTSSETAQLFGEQNLDILSVTGLNNAMSAGQEENIKKRFESYAELKSLFRLVVVDSEEQFNNRTFSVSGIDAIMGMMYTLVAGAADIPVTRLLGTSAKGLNSTGEGDVRNYYDNIGARQESELRQMLDWMDTFAFKSDSLDAEKLEYSFPSLWQESETERDARLLNRAQRDQIYLLNGIVTEGQIASELVADKVYNFIDDEYVEALNEMGESDFEEEEGEPVE